MTKGHEREAAVAVNANQAGHGQLIITRAGLALLLAALQRQGYRLIGPRVVDGAIGYTDIAGIDDLPRGWTAVQEAGQYRLQRRADAALFGYAVGPHSLKRYLHPPRLRLWQLPRTAMAGRTSGDADLDPEAESPTGPQTSAGDAPNAPFAFIGVRPCELRALAIQDRVLLGGRQIDPHYQARRADNFIVAVACANPGGTCFCQSMDSGPGLQDGFDLGLTELDTAPDQQPEQQRLLLAIGSTRARALLTECPHRPATADECAQGAQLVTAAAAAMGRHLPRAGLRERLLAVLEHPHWEQVGARCLGCANCTMVCPTCFCTSVSDHTDLTGTHAERIRRWDSCFTGDFSYIHGGNVRQHRAARYRQWLLHKLAYWHDQFGSPGCVGCGRCITWCPVGIDLSAEASALAAIDAPAADSTAVADLPTARPAQSAAPTAGRPEPETQTNP